MATDPGERALAAALDLRRWIESRELQGVDPYDALRSPFLARVGRTPKLRQACIQLLRRLPFDPRPLLGIRPYRQPKALGLIAAASAKLYGSTGDEAWAGLANRAADGAVELAIEMGEGIAWGYPFDVQLRWGFYPAGTPNAIATVFTANGLLVAADLLARPDLAEAAGASAPFLDSLATGNGEQFYAYVPENSTPIHNANLLTAALRARLAAHGNAPAPDHTHAALAYSLRRQRPDGSWPYGEAPGCEWVDGFHTAYVLSALVDFDELSGQDETRAALVRGASYYVENLFEDDGTPRYYARDRYPIDSHNAATAISTLLRLEPYEPRATALVERVAAWALPRLQTRAGWFLYQRGRLLAKRVPYLRWSDAHMLRALADLCEHARV